MNGRPEQVDLPDEARTVLGCPDCNSEVTATKAGLVMQINVGHDENCPWFQGKSDGRPFIGAVVVNPKAKP